MKSFLGKKLLVVTAHPDDESYAAAGTIYRNNKEGGKTVLICATLGEKGTSHLKRRLSMNQLKNMRKKELLGAAKFLGISRVHLIGLPDGKVNHYSLPLYKKILAIARRYKPEVVLSFGENGISGHFDHIAVGRAAKKISREIRSPFVEFALPPILKNNAEKWLKTRRKSKHYVSKIAFRKPTINVSINPKVKKKALRFHKSQMDSKNAFTGFPKYAMNELLKKEHFVG